MENCPGQRKIVRDELIEHALAEKFPFFYSSRRTRLQALSLLPPSSLSKAAVPIYIHDLDKGIVVQLEL